MVFYVRPPPQMAALWCSERSLEVVMAVGYLEGEGTIPSSSPGSKQKDGE